MADSNLAKFLFPSHRVGGAGLSPSPGAAGLDPEGQPSVIWGQGTPNGDLAPFTLINKGSIYMEVNGTDDNSSAWQKVDEGDDNSDWAKFMVSPQTIAQTYVNTELHGWDLLYTGTQISAGNLVAFNIKHTTAGTAGGWSAGLFVNITQGTTKNVNGYLCAAELEVTNTADNVSDWFVLVLNAVNSGNQQGSHSSYIALRDYGSLDLNSLLWIADHSIGSNSATVLMSTATSTYETDCDHAIRFVAGSTPYWLLVSSTAPN